MSGEKTPEKPSAVSVGSTALFGGKDADQQNALKDALTVAAADYALTIPEEVRTTGGTNSGIYQYLEETPCTSMIVELVAALNKLGWRITRSKPSPNTTMSNGSAAKNP